MTILSTPHNFKRISLTILQFRRLIYFEYSGNEIENISPQVERFLNRIRTNTKSSVYDDQQNVHNSTIQKTILKSLISLLSDKLQEFDLITEIINDNVLSKKTKSLILQYCESDDVHSEYNTTYSELMKYVWNRIRISSLKSEICELLNIEIIESYCKCFTGRFNRTINVLTTFFDDIQIQISDNDRITAVVLNIKKKYSNNYEKQIEECKKILFEAGYTLGKIQPWLDEI